MSWRLGTYVRGKVEVPDWVRDRLLEITTREKIFAPLEFASEYIDELTKILNDYCEYIRRQAKGEEPPMKVYYEYTCCNISDGRCGTCLGKYGLHGPYFFWRDRKKRRRKVKERDLREFLRRWLNEQQIEDFYRVQAMRGKLLQFFHYWALFWTDAGVIEGVV